MVEGNRRTSLRQDVLAELDRRGQRCHCIRCREVRGRNGAASTSWSWTTLVYPAAQAEEHFLQFVTPEDQHRRLSAPLAARLQARPTSLGRMPDLHGAALVREVHVYGQSLAVGSEQPGAAQHIGLGTRLLDRAAEIARARGYQRLAVIAAVGTRLYYQFRGFSLGENYMVKEI